MSKQNRQALAELKALLPAFAKKPVNMRPVIAGLHISIVAGHDGRKRKNESELVAFARAMRCSPVRLFELAYRDRKRFRARLAPLIAGYPRGPEFADDIACEIVMEFLREELTWQYVELAAAAGWKPPERLPLCKYRPCRPADYRAPTMADLCFAE